MDLKTVLDVGDTAYFMHENKVIETEIVQININIKGPIGLITTTYIVGVDKPVSSDLVFGSKQELLESL